MVAILVGNIPVYQSDLGTDVENLRFKIRDDKLATSGYPEADGVVCSGAAGLFKHRYLQAEYPDRSVIRYPAGTILDIPTVAQDAINDGAVCVHLEGEEWTFIPPSFMPGNPEPNYVEYPVDAGVAQVETGVTNYTSDLLGGIRVKYKVELFPNQILTAIKQCLTDPEIGTFPCTAGSQIKPRHLTVRARREGNRQIARKTLPAEAGGADILLCAAQLLATGYCVSYKGESARNVQVLLNITAA